MDLDEKIFNFAYEFALRDATLQNAYTGSLDVLRKNAEAKLILRAYIDTIFAGNAYEGLFWETAQRIEESFAAFLDGRQPRFTFGNTQKLINMTTKYMFIACYQNSGLRRSFASCHCPMDRIMVDRVIKELERVFALSSSIEERHQIRSLMSRGWKNLLRSPWSKMESSNVDQYKLYQRIVRFLSEREGISPLEYDFFMWRQE